MKERENDSTYHKHWIRHQNKVDSVYKKKSLEQQLTQCAQQVSSALRGQGVEKQPTQIRVILSDAVRKASDIALSKSWPAAVHLRGLEKGEPVRSASSSSGDLEKGVIVRVKANGNYDIEKRVDDLGPVRFAAVQKQMEKTGIRQFFVEDMNVAPADIIEEEGARRVAFQMTDEPEWELSVLEACRQFDLKKVAVLLGTAIPSAVTFGANRTERY